MLDKASKPQLFSESPRCRPQTLQAFGSKVSLKKAISERVTSALERQTVLLAEAVGILQVDKSFSLLSSSVAPGGAESHHRDTCPKKKHSISLLITFLICRLIRTCCLWIRYTRTHLIRFCTDSIKTGS